MKVSKRKGLGRGLDALLGGSGSAGEFHDLKLAEIKRSRFQPRLKMDKDELTMLAQSVAVQGVIQPVLVRLQPSGGYQLVAGERRWRAAQLAGLESIPARVCDLTDQQALEFALVENIQRQDLNIVEQAKAMERLIGKCNYTHEQLAAALGKSRESVTNTLRLLKLEKEVLELLEEGALEMGHGRALLGLSGSMQGEIAHLAAKEQLSVRQVERLVAESRRAPGAKVVNSPQNDEADRLSRRLSDSWGAEVHIRSRRGGSGSLVIRYGSAEELDGILQRLGCDPELL